MAEVASVLLVDDELPRPRLPGVLPTQTWASSPPLRGPQGSASPSGRWTAVKELIIEVSTAWICSTSDGF